MRRIAKTTVFLVVLLALDGCDDDDAAAGLDGGQRDAGVEPDGPGPEPGDAGPGDGGPGSLGLREALDQHIEVNRALTDPALTGDPAATRAAVAAGAPAVASVQARLEAALMQVGGDVRPLVEAALAEVRSEAEIAALIATETDANVPLRLAELITHGGVAVSSIHLALLQLGAAPVPPDVGHVLALNELTVPAGYTVEIVANRLTFASVVAVAADGTIYVGEAGYSYGNVRAPARVLRVDATGRTEVVAEGFEGPLAGLAIDGNQLFVSHRGTITRVDLSSGAKTDIVTGLPSTGDHFNENIGIGPDGKLYIAQGTATNSGVVGPDNYFFGWLQQAPEFHDIPCRDLRLNGESFRSGDPLTQDATDIVTTGPFLPFGTPASAGQVVRGEVKCSGAVLRANLDGSGLEVFADGFRNPYGLAFHPDGRLFVTENGPDTRGSRPVEGPDNFYEVIQGGWYGWPDYYGGVLIDDPSRRPAAGPPSPRVLADPPPLAGMPVAELTAHTASNGFDFARGTFGPADSAYIAQFGDLAPNTSGGAPLNVGHRVVQVASGRPEEPFLTSATYPDGEPFLRPTDATFTPDGSALYVVHFGEVRAVPGGIFPSIGTGALIRITRTAP